MTKYNERLDEILERYAEAICSYAFFGSPFNSDEDNIAGAEALYQTSQNEAKQAIIDWHNKQVRAAIIHELKEAKHSSDAGWYATYRVAELEKEQL